MSNMKTVSVREAQHHLGAVLEEVQRGRTITLTKRGRVVAKIVPARVARRRATWPDFEARMKRLFPAGPPPGAPASLLIRDMRDEKP